MDILETPINIVKARAVTAEEKGQSAYAMLKTVRTDAKYEAERRNEQMMIRRSDCAANEIWLGSHRVIEFLVFIILNTVISNYTHISLYI